MNRDSQLLQLVKELKPKRPDERRRALSAVSPNDPELGKDALRILAHLDKLNERPKSATDEPQPKYRLNEGACLGRGGMGTVYSGQELSTGRQVAMKLPHTLKDAKEFIDAAKIHKSLRHPYIVEVMDVITHDGCPCMVMEYLARGSLKKSRDGNPFSERQAATVVLQIAKACSYIHGLGFVHRDVKPSNIMIVSIENEQFWVKLGDCGLIKQLTEEEKVSTDSRLVGTVKYMAPEQANLLPQSVSVRTDIFASGIVLYEMLTGNHPFPANTTFETLTRLRADEPLAPRKHVRTIDRDLEAICLKCLEKNPGDRYQSADQLAEDLELWLDKKRLKWARRSTWKKLRRWAKRRPGVAALSIALAVVAVGSGTGITFKWREAKYNWGIAEERGQQAQTNLQIAEGRRLEGLTFLDRLLEVVDTFLDAVAENTQFQQSDIRPGVHVALRALQAHLEQLLNERPSDPELLCRRALCQLHIGLIEHRLGQNTSAIRRFEEERQTLEQLRNIDPNRELFRSSLALCYTRLGVSLMLTQDKEDTNKAHSLHEKARELLAGLVSERPQNLEYCRRLAGAYNHLGQIARQNGDASLAEDYLRKAQAILEDARIRVAEEPPERAALMKPRLIRDLGKVYNNLGSLLKFQKNLEQAELILRKAVKIYDELLEESPLHADYRLTRGRAGRNLGDILSASKKYREAEKEYFNAARPQQKLVEEDPKNEDYRADLGLTHRQLGLLYRSDGRRREAAEAFQHAAVEYTVASRAQNGRKYLIQLSYAYRMQGNCWFEIDKPDLARPCFGSALEATRAMDEATAKVWAFHAHLGLAMSLAQLGLHDDAWDELQKAKPAEAREESDVQIVALYLRAYKGEETAATAADELKSRILKEPTAAKDEQVYNLAAVYAVLAKTVGKETDAYARNAFELLKLRAEVFFADPSWREQLEKQADFETLRLRYRPEFERLKRNAITPIAPGAKE